MEEVDWDIAPSGATHYNAEFKYPWLKEKPISYFNGDGWIEYHAGLSNKYAMNHLKNAVKRHQEWDGEEMSKCYAVQHSDQMVCERCYQAWDVNDVCEPECDPAVCIDMSEEGGMKSKEWDGSGLPPVGTVCEYRLGEGTWFKCKVVYMLSGTDDCFVAWCEHVGSDQFLTFSSRRYKLQLRKIKTPEQIEAEERLHAIDEMLVLVGRYSTFKDVMGDLYDAGYRKVEV